MNEIVPIEQVETEIAAIEREMGTKAYWGDDAKQARYRSLLDRRQTRNDILMDADDEPVMPIVSEKEFLAEHGSLAAYPAYLKAAYTAADVLTQLGGDDLASINASFEALPDDVAEACIAELASKAPPRATILNHDLDKFGTTPVGMALLREWGRDAHDRLGTLRARMERALSSLDERGAALLLDWFDELTDEAAKAVFRRMSA